MRHTVETLADRGASQAAAVVLDNATGEVLAWVGSPDFWADTAGQVDMVVSPRQPGSALKPFLYALAFDRGYTPAIDPARRRSACTRPPTGPYRPRNYDRRFHGPVRAREALASSYNLPAVELADRLGAGSLLHLLREAGFTSLDRSAEYYGLGPRARQRRRDAARARQRLPRARERRRVAAVALDARRAPGDAGRARPPDRDRALGRAGARHPRRPGRAHPGFGVETPLDFPFPVAAKTGTSRHFTDNWAVGVTGGFTVAVWVGNFSGRPMDGVSGVSGAGPLLHRRRARDRARGIAPGALPTPEDAGAVPVTICRLSGLRATAALPDGHRVVRSGHRARRLCDWHDADGTRLARRVRRVGAAERSWPVTSPLEPRIVHAAAASGVARPDDGRLPDSLAAGGRRVPCAGRRRRALRDRRAPRRGRDRRAGGSLVRGRASLTGARWALQPGRHRIRALDGCRCGGRSRSGGRHEHSSRHRHRGRSAAQPRLLRRHAGPAPGEADGQLRRSRHLPSSTSATSWAGRARS